MIFFAVRRRRWGAAGSAGAGRPGRWRLGPRAQLIAAPPLLRQSIPCLSYAPAVHTTLCPCEQHGGPTRVSDAGCVAPAQSHLSAHTHVTSTRVLLITHTTWPASARAARHSGRRPQSALHTLSRTKPLPAAEGDSPLREVIRRDLARDVVAHLGGRGSGQALRLRLR